MPSFDLRYVYAQVAENLATASRNFEEEAFNATYALDSFDKFRHQLEDPVAVGALSPFACPAAAPHTGCAAPCASFCQNAGQSIVLGSPLCCGISLNPNPLCAVAAAALPTLYSRLHPA